jgi:UbiA prenyltransferase family protein
VTAVTATSTAPSSFELWLRLGRVSNLPTVWSNVLAALALSGALARQPDPAHLLLLALAFSVFYVGGMFLNDAFDRHIDRAQRPDRPIPSGRVSAGAVFGAGFAALALGTALTGAVAWDADASIVRAAGSGALLAAVIVLYDVYHKQNPLSPVVMGACRVLVYVCVGYAVGLHLSPALLLGAGALWCYLIGLTYAAKQEAFNRLTRVWPLVVLGVPLLYCFYLNFQGPWVWAFVVGFVVWVGRALSFLQQGPQRAVPQAVVRLIAGISLLDAVLIAGNGSVAWAVVAASMCALTRVFQRAVPGT